VYCIYTAEDIVKLLSLSGSSITSFLTPAQIPNSKGTPSVGAQNTRLENLRFLTEITIYLKNEINENQIFPTPVYFVPLLTGFPWNWVSGQRVKKLE